MGYIRLSFAGFCLGMHWDGMLHFEHAQWWLLGEPCCSLIAVLISFPHFFVGMRVELHAFQEAAVPPRPPCFRLRSYFCLLYNLFVKSEHFEVFSSILLGPVPLNHLAFVISIRALRSEFPKSALDMLLGSASWFYGVAPFSMTNRFSWHACY